MPQNVIVAATQQSVSFPAGTMEIGFHRFTLQLQPAGPVVTHLETVDSTTFESPAEGEHELTYATIGTDGTTVLGPIQSVMVNVGGQVSRLVAGGISYSVVTNP
jgi:hypothetical protein